MRFLWFPLVILIISCASAPRAESYPSVYLTNRARFRLLPPSAIEKNIDRPQQMAGTFGNQEFLVESWVRADEKGVEIAFFNSFGMNIGELSFTESALRFDSEVLPGTIKPEYILADFQLCFYQPRALASALGACGLTLETRQTGPIETRILRDKKQILAEIEKNPARLKYTNRFREYEYTLLF